MASATYVFSSGTILSAEVNRNLGDLNDQFFATTGTAHNHDGTDSKELLEGGVHVDRSILDATEYSQQGTSPTTKKTWTWTAPHADCVVHSVRLYGSSKQADATTGRVRIVVTVKNQTTDLGTRNINSEPSLCTSTVYVAITTGMCLVSSATTDAADDQISNVQNATITIAVQVYASEAAPATGYLDEHYVEVTYSYPYAHASSPNFS